MTDTNDAVDIGPSCLTTVDHSSSHGSVLMDTMRSLYQQGVFTDCRLLVEDKRIECHRVVLSACSPVLHKMLTSGLTETESRTIPVYLFTADIMDCIIKYMYSGVLSITHDQLYEAVAASNFFELTELHHSLDEQAKYCVSPSNVFEWQSFAEYYNLLLAAEMCSRMQLVQFEKVVQHKEFLDLTREEVMTYLLKCQPYAHQIGHDVILKAADAWMTHNGVFEGLLGCINLQECSKQTLAEVASHNAELQNNTTAGGCAFNTILPMTCPPKKQTTLAYLTSESCVIVDTHGHLRTLCTHPMRLYNSMVWTYFFCPMENGFLWLTENNSIQQRICNCSIHRFVPEDLKLKRLPGTHLKPRGFNLTTTHENKLYIIPFLDQDDIECYDFDTGSWSKIRNPTPRPGGTWNAATVDDKLYLINDDLRLFRLDTDCTKEIKPNIKFPRPAGFHVRLCLTGVREWLYVILIYQNTNGKSKCHMMAYCYNTTSNIWTRLASHLECETPCIGRSLHFENKIFMESRGNKASLYEYDLATNIMSKSKRPHPSTKAFGQFLLKLDANQLDAESTLPIYEE